MDLLAALNGVSAERAPIWIMRQAGRYLPEYRAIKNRATFGEMTRDPAIAAEVTLQPLRRFELDAAIIFSDIMTPLEALGVEIAFEPGPVVAVPIRSAQAVRELRLREPVAPYVGEAIRLVRSELRDGIALIGFAGAPLTLAAYLVEGSGSREYATFRAFLRSDPQAMHELLEKLAELTIVYLTMQIEAGAQVVQLFDSWAGLHDLPTYREFGVAYNTRIMEAIGATGAARIFFANGASHLIDAVAEIPAEGIGIDWRTDLRAVRRHLSGRTLQGNLDPAALFADAAGVQRAALRVLEQGLGGPHIFNLGHGIFPSTPIAAVSQLVETVRAYRRQ